MDNKYMVQLSLDPIVSAVPYTEGERKIYQKHRLRVVRMDRENIKSIYKESKKAVKELKSLPITSLNHEINDNLRRLEKEDEKLMFQVFDKVSHLKTIKKELKKDDQVYEPQIKNKRTKKYKLREIKNEITRK